MTPKQMALSQLARLALKNANGSKPNEKLETLRLVAAALQEDCPDIAELASSTASKIAEAERGQLKLTQLLDA